MSLNQSDTITITNLNIIGTVDPNFISYWGYVVSNVTNGYFQLTTSPGTQVTSFTDTQIKNNQVQFIHTGGTNPQSFNVATSDGTDTSTLQAVNITFIPFPTLLKNQITIKQGKTITITNSSLYPTGGDKFTLTVYISNVQFVYFQLYSNPGVNVTSFTKTQIDQNLVQMTQDGSTSSPIFTIKVSDGYHNSSVYNSNVTFFLLPVLFANQLLIKQGKNKLLATSMINGTCGAGLILTYTATFVLNGQFENVIHKRSTRCKSNKFRC